MLSKIRKLIKKLKKSMARAVSSVPKRKFMYQIYTNLFRVNKKVVLIESFHGQNISDSSLEFAKEILRLYPGQYTIYFATEKIKEDAQFIKSIGLNVKLTDVTTLRYPKVLATAGYILTNGSLPIYFIKRKEQTYLQTWHGTPLKTLGKSMRRGIDSMCVAQHSFLQADYLTEPNDFTKDIIMHDYNLERLYTGKVVMAGYPRNTIFMHPEKAEELRAQLGLQDKTVYAYMPTWRGTSNQSIDITNYAAEIKEKLSVLDKQLHDDQLLFVNFHPILHGAIQLDGYRHVRTFPETADNYAFLNCTDALITDYSSVFFDYSLTKKPVILYLYDYDEYMHDRGVNMDIRSLPFRMVYTTEELGKVLGSGECLNDRYDDTEYYNTFFKYDAPDITERLLNMVFTGDESGFTVHDYSHNKNRKLTVYEPLKVNCEYDLKTLSAVVGDNGVAVLYRKWFKGEISQILHDKYNDDFDYLVTTYTPPRTFVEEFLSFLGVGAIRRRIHQREIARLLPHLDVRENFVNDYGTFEIGCNIAQKDTKEMFLTTLEETPAHDIRVTFALPEGYAPVSAAVLGFNNALLATPALQSDGSAVYDFTALMESLTVFRNQTLTLGVIGEKDGKKVFFAFKDKEKPLPKRVNPRDKFSFFYAPCIKEYSLPADYYRANLQRLTFSLEEKTRQKLENWDLTKVPTAVCAAPFIATKDGRLRVYISHPDNTVDKMSSGAKLKSVSCPGNRTRLKIFVAGVRRENVEGMRMIYRSKTEDITIDLACTVQETKDGCIIRVDHPFDATQGLKEVFWDVRVVLNLFGKTHLLKVTNGSYINTLKFYFTNCQSKVDEENIVFPYFGRKRVLCYTYRNITPFDTTAARIKEMTAFTLYHLCGVYFRRKKLRIIYEKFCKTAQDNSYYFFKYCMEELPEKEKKNIFYIIDKSAPDYERIKEYDKHIVQFMSLRHMIYVMAMKVCVSTDSTPHLYLWRTKPSIIRRSIKKTPKELFLQHGVTALKRVHPIFGRKSASPMRYYVTTSKNEHDIIVSEFGYKKNDVPIVGFCRWDVLEDKSKPDDKMILLMPTWRSWLEEVDDSIFVESDYYKNYSALLTDKRLNEKLQASGTRLVLYLHPKFAEYTDTFADKVSDNITYVPFGERSLNDLLMESHMLITDYSSVCWDELYQNKPVLFYQFDYERYNLAHGSYINMEKDLPGDRTEHLDTLVDYIGEYIDAGLKIKPQHEEMAKNWFAYRDHANSKRTFEFLKSQGL